MRERQREYYRRHYQKEYRPAYDALMKFYPLTLENLDDELWQPIAGYDDYHISNYGRMKSFCKGKVKILKPSINGQGYLTVGLTKDGKQKPFRINRLVALAFIPSPNAKPQINHIDCHKLNNYVENLEWVTARENIKHTYDMGLAPKGQERPEAKLTNEQVIYVRENPEGLTQCQLAEKFGLNRATISYIQTGKTFKIVGGTIRKARKVSPQVPNDLRKKIRAEYKAGGVSQRALAKKYGLGQVTISRIAKE